jgi:hypothetical protein
MFEFNNPVEVSPIRAVLDHEVLKGLTLYKQPARFNGTPIDGLFDIGAQVQATPATFTGVATYNQHQPVKNRVTAGYELRQPEEVLTQSGLANMVEKFELNLETVTLATERHGAVSGCNVVYRVPLEGSEETGLGPHYLQCDVGARWNGTTSDYVEWSVWDQWCSNGCVSKTHRLKMTARHSVGHLNKINPDKVYGFVKEFLEYKVKLGQTKLTRDISVLALQVHAAGAKSREELLDHVSLCVTNPVTGITEYPNDHATRCTIHEGASGIVREGASRFIEGGAARVGKISNRWVNSYQDAVIAESRRMHYDFDRTSALGLFNVLTRQAQDRASGFSAKEQEMFESVTGVSLN